MALARFGAVECNYERPWVRQPFDTDISFSLLSDYVLLAPGARKASSVGRALVRRGIVSVGQICIWEREHGWPERASAWDRHVQAIREDAIEDMTRRHAAMGFQLSELASRELARLSRHADRIASTEGLPLLQARDILRFVDVGIRVERDANRAQTAPSQSGPDLSELTIDELRALAGISR